MPAPRPTARLCRLGHCQSHNSSQCALRQTKHAECPRRAVLAAYNSVSLSGLLVCASTVCARAILPAAAQEACRASSMADLIDNF